MFNWFRRSSKSAPATPAAPGRVRSAARAPAPKIRATYGDIPGTRLTAADGSPLSAFSPDTQRILAQLPPEVSLAASCAKYPHAVEKLLRHWRNPKEFRMTIEAMLIDTRGGRKGFPFDVLSEFGRLREHYDLRVDPVKSNAWGSIDVR